MNYPIRVLVVDDSPFMRKVISEMLLRSPFLEVVATARDGREGLEQSEELHPDVILTDLYMPEMDGVTFIREQMARQPLPVVVCSVAGEGGDAMLAAMDAGAVEFVQKPSALANDDVYRIQGQLVRAVTAAASADLSNLTPQQSPQPETAQPVQFEAEEVDAVVIGLSTGGPQALRYLLPKFPADLPVPIAIVLHMPPGYTHPFAEKLNESSEIEVCEAAEGLAMQPGRAILAQAGYHLRLENNPNGLITAHLDFEPAESLHRPSVDVLFRSAADAYGSRILGVVMTGMGNDGTAGSAWIKANGGRVFVESESSSVIYGMPRSVVEAGLADQIIPLTQMAQSIMEAL